MPLLESQDDDFIGKRAVKRDNFNSLIADKRSSQKTGGYVVINGVALSQNVVGQLLMHGDNPEWCTPGQLEAAEQGAIIDCNVVDDPDDPNYFGSLVLDENEKAEDQAAEPVDDNEDELSDAQLIVKEQQREQERCRMRMDVKVFAGKHTRANTYAENNNTLDKKDDPYLASNHIVPRSYREQIREENRLEKEKSSKSGNSSSRSGAACTAAQ